MILLGIESATDLVGVSVADDHGPRACVWTTGGRRHGEVLAPAIAYVLEQAKLALEDLDAVAVDLGPGLFTGLRVGVVTAKALAQGLGVGIVGVSSLDVLARAAFDAGCQGPVAAVVDARRGEVFAARFRAAPGGTRRVMEEVSPAARFVPADLAAELAEAMGSAGSGGSAKSGGAMLAVGDGARRYAAELSEVPGLVLAGPSLASPPPAVLVTLAAERLAAGAVPVPPVSIQPIYLRDADARINWVQRQTSSSAR